MNKFNIWVIKNGSLLQSAQKDSEALFELSEKEHRDW